MDYNAKYRETCDLIEKTVAKMTGTTDGDRPELTLPPGYDVHGALIGAKRPLFQVHGVTDGTYLWTDIGIALRDMVYQGLRADYNQCYFVPKQKRLVLTRSYRGTELVVKRMHPEIASINSRCVFADDVFQFGYKNGIPYVKLHEHDDTKDPVPHCMLANIRYAYALIIGRDGQIIGGDIMDASQISSAWKNSSNQSIQHQFPEQMAQRSVINRAIKPFIEGGEIRTDYGEAFVSAVTETSANEYDDPDDACQPQQEKDDGFGRRFNLGGLGRPMKARTEEAPKEDPA